MRGLLDMARQWLKRRRLQGVGQDPDLPGRRRFLALTALAPLGAAVPVLAQMKMDEGQGGHEARGGQPYVWSDPSVAVTPPPSAPGGGLVHTPHLPALGHEMDGQVKVFRLVAQPVERALVDGPPTAGSVWRSWHDAMGAMSGMDKPRKAKLWGFNGSVPGPAIEAVQGDRVRIVVKNELPEPTSIHWHGLEVPNDQDGVGGLTSPPIMPGGQYVYEFTLHQTGTFMYHSSFNETKQVGLGMGGFFIIHPKDGSGRVDRDIAILLQEWSIPPESEYVSVMSMEPNWFAMNGKCGPSTEVLEARVGEKVRLRFANLSNLFAHPIHLHGVSWRVTGTESGPIPESARWPGNTVNVAPGQAREVEFSFKNPGYWHMHCHKLHHIMNGHGEAMSMAGIMPMGGMTMLFAVSGANGEKPVWRGGREGMKAAPAAPGGHGGMPGMPGMPGM